MWLKRKDKSLFTKTTVDIGIYQSKKNLECWKVLFLRNNLLMELSQTFKSLLIVKSGTPRWESPINVVISYLALPVLAKAHWLKQSLLKYTFQYVLSTVLTTSTTSTSISCSTLLLNSLSYWFKTWIPFLANVKMLKKTIILHFLAF